MNKWNTFVKFCWWTSLVMTLVLFWDHYVLKVDNSTVGYILTKGITIGGFFWMGVYSSHYKRVGPWMQETYGILFYIYSYYGMAHLDMTYSFSFIEAFFILALGMRTSISRFVAVSGLGLVGVIAGHYYAQEPLFVAIGQSYRHHSFTVTFILFIVSFVIHFFVTRQQNQIQDLNEKFALVGKHSSFLMHELKSPLNRVVANSKEDLTVEIMKDIRRDSQKISALVNSVEILIHDPKSLTNTFANFDWSEISENLNEDFQSYFKSMNIRFNCAELRGKFYGNKPLMYQLLKNHILNAIEAIGFRKDEMSDIFIRLQTIEKKIVLTVTNTNSVIPNKDLTRVFEPHFTTKTNGNNKGLGLALVKSIVDAHGGKIKVSSGSNETSFEISLPQYATEPV